MVKKDQLPMLTLTDLKRLKTTIEGNTKKSVLEAIDTIIEEKEYEASQSLNSQFLVEWFNIDGANIRLLQANGINNLAQLRELDDDGIWQLKGMTFGGFEQISWAKDFFDMTTFENLPPEDTTRMKLVKTMVKEAQQCGKKHQNV